MKRKLLSLGVVALGAISSNAQVFSDDFNAGIGSSWTLFDVDGATPNANVAQFTDAFIGTTVGGEDCAASTSWINPLGQVDDWMCTNAITLPAVPAGGGLVLEFMAIAPDPTYADGVEVYVNTNGNTPTDMLAGTNIYNSTATGEPDAWTARSVDLAAFAGQTVHIGFRNNSNDKYILGIDDVVVKTLSANDIALTAISTPAVIVAGNVDITGTVTNAGAADITSFTLTWDDGSGLNSQTVTPASPIVSGGTYNFTHSTQLAATAGTTYNVDVCATVANDGDNTNDCMTSMHSTASGTGTRLPLMELFTSSTCPPCYSLNYTGFGGSGLNSYLDGANANDQSNATLAVVKYQVNWPGNGDHAYNADAGTRVTKYGVTGAPTLLIDAASAGAPADVTSAANVATYVDISATHSFSGGNMISVDVNVDPYASYNNAIVHIALLDKSYDATSAASFSNGETEFHHVLRKLLPTAGTSVNLVSGTASTVNESYTFSVNSGLPTQGSFDLHGGSDREVVVWVEDAAGNILNSAISQGATSEITTGINDEASKIELNAYPNPTNDIANVKFNLSENEDVTVELVNTLGQTVSTQDLGSVNGEQVVRFNTNNLEAGIYLINVNVNGVISTKRLSVTK